CWLPTTVSPTSQSSSKSGLNHEKRNAGQAKARHWGIHAFEVCAECPLNAAASRALPATFLYAVLPLPDYYFWSQSGCKILKARQFQRGTCLGRVVLMARVVQLLAVPVCLAVLLVTIVRGSGDSPVAKAVKAGDLPAVRKLIAAHADVNAVSGDGS